MTPTAGPMEPEIVMDALQALACVFADRVAAEAHAAIAVRGQFSCALPGGSVAETFVPVLARRPVAWDLVQTFLAADFSHAERHVCRLGKVARMEASYGQRPCEK